MKNENWLLFTYKVPNEPSALRVFVWRKLKGLGAILLHDTAWVLPANSHTSEKFRWLAAEVKEMNGGEATLWEAKQLFTGQQTNLREQFIEQVDARYREILEELAEEEVDLEALAKRYQQIKMQDYFQSELGKRVREKIVKRRGA